MAHDIDGQTIQNKFAKQNEVALEINRQQMNVQKAKQELAHGFRGRKMNLHLKSEGNKLMFRR